MIMDSYDMSDVITYYIITSSLQNQGEIRVGRRRRQRGKRVGNAPFFRLETPHFNYRAAS